VGKDRDENWAHATSTVATEVTAAMNRGFKDTNPAPVIKATAG
jgi:hypothetical protein